MQAVRARRSDRGSVAVHVVIVPAAMTLFLFVVQVSFWFYSRSVATAAAEHALEAARVYSENPGAAEAAGKSTADDFLNQVGGIEGYQVDVNRGADTVTVTVEGSTMQVLPSVMIWDVPINVTMEAPVERLAE